MTQLATGVSHKRRAKFIVGAAVVALTVFVLVGWAMSRPGSTAFYLTVSELQASGPPAGASDYRVNGVVVPGSVEKKGLETTFALTDGDATLPVVTDTPLPDTFRDRSEVVATGSFDGRSFTASQVLAKCPSKFKAKT
jgi:cytochrome c-type biogenesis protein CcmE